MNIVDKTAREELEKIKDYVVYDDDSVYGLSVDFVNNKFERLGAAKLLDAGEDFDNVGPWKRRRCNLTDNGVVLSYVGDEAFSEDGYTHQTIVKDNVTYPINTEVQVMVEQPKFWYKVDILETEDIPRHLMLQYDTNVIVPGLFVVYFEITPIGNPEGEIISYVHKASSSDVPMSKVFSAFYNYLIDNKKESDDWDFRAVFNGCFVSKSYDNFPTIDEVTTGVSIYMKWAIETRPQAPVKVAPGISNRGISKANYFVSSTPKLGFSVHPAFKKGEEEFDNIYIGAYSSTYNKKLSAASIKYEFSYKNPNSASNYVFTSLELANEISYRYKNWSNQTISALSILQILFLIETKSFNINSLFPKLRIEDPTKIGETSVLKNASGWVDINDEYCVASYRGQEISNTRYPEYIEGVSEKYSFPTSNIYITNDDFTFSPDTFIDSALIDGGTLPSVSGYISRFSAPTKEKDKYLMIPLSVEGNSIEPVGDYYNHSTRLFTTSSSDKFYFCLGNNESSGFFPYSARRYNANNETFCNIRLQYLGKPASEFEYRTISVKIDMTNSDPLSSVTRVNDSKNGPINNYIIDKFFGHYPCLFKDGKEIGRLDPDDFSKFIDGTAADITSGVAGDVMIAFPRRGVKIETVGNIITVSMTDDPDNADFEYLAHTRGTVRKEKFYLGAYKGYNLSSKLRSLNSKTPTVSQTIGTFRTLAKANGTDYDQSGFYQFVFRQVMYLLKYKNLDSQTAIGRGYVDRNGGTNTKGMDFGERTGKLQMKLFGLEDFYGNVWEWIDGVVTNSTRNILTATTGFNDTGTGYADQGQGASANIGSWLSKPQGTTKTGFLAKEVTGSETTYFCDSAILYASSVAYFGGDWSNASYAGAFHLSVDYAASSSNANIAARLMYL